MKRILACSAVGAALTLVACHPSTPPAAVEPATQAADTAAPAAPAASAAAALPQADKTTADSAYVKIESGNQLMFLYYALSGIPADYEAMAQRYSSEYRGTTDNFRKQDIMSALKPRLDAGIAAAKTQRYFIYEVSQPDLQHYDFATHSFAMNSIDDGYTWYVNDNSAFKFQFGNAAAFHQLAVADEASARRIEGLVGRYPAPALTVYGYAQDVDLNEKLIEAQIVKVILHDAHGNSLAQN